MNSTSLREFATRYTAAWCSQNAASVAAFFAEDGSLKINDGMPSVGRKAITEAAQGFMTAFPDMVVTMEGINLQGENAIYRWTLTGTNSGAGGTGKAVRISGHEEWTIGADGLIAASEGHFDEADYQRQLGAGSVAVTDKDVADLTRRTADANAALVRGDIDGYLALIEHANDYTLMAPFGGETTRGFDTSSERRAAIARFFRSGTFDQEVVATYDSGDLVVLVTVERVRAQVGGLPEQDWSLRVTQVFRRDGAEWQLVHRPLIRS